MAKSIYPTYGICNLKADKSKNELWNADRFNDYLAGNPHLNTVHTHNFYHLLYFTEGSGSHLIDFIRFPVHPGMIYFMRPGQVHAWEFTGEVDGYIINFSPTFFDGLFINSQFIDNFSFFGANVEQQVVQIPEKNRDKILSVFEDIIKEQTDKLPSAQMMIAALLIRLFLLVERGTESTSVQNEPSYNANLVRDFRQLIEKHFYEMRLPKDYAAMLYITPRHLNTICRETLGISAGEVIRNRVLLESKRLLVNFERSIADIAYTLNFPDSSYFVKFFKKHTALTPETFRNQNYRKSPGE